MNATREFINARNPGWIYVAVSLPCFSGIVTRCYPATPAWKRRVERMIERALSKGWHSSTMIPGHRSVKLHRAWPYAGLTVLLQEDEWH